jgi:hypothetical protein
MMGLVDGFVLLGLFLFGLPLAAVVGTLLGKLFHVPRLGSWLPGLVLLVILFGVPVALRVAGVRATARVQEKRERVTVFNYTGSWYNSYHLGVRFKPPEASRADPTSRSPMSDSIALNVAATRDLFDRARVGGTVDVVYLPFRPSIGRLAERSFVDLLREMLAVPDILLGLVALFATVVAIMLSNRSLSNPTVRAARAILVGACLITIVGAGWLAYQNPTSIPESAVNTPGVGRVVQMRRVDRTLLSFSSPRNNSEPLAQPFDVVEVEFTPPILNQVVHAADAVDSGSVHGLGLGGLLPIRYDARSPRTIRITGGTRTFRVRNARSMAGQTLFVLTALLVLVGTSALMARRKKTVHANVV